jgi:hypothetical protein
MEVCEEGEVTVSEGGLCVGNGGRRTGALKRQGDRFDRRRVQVAARERVELVADVD